MKRLGIVGGIGPESTIEYYRLALAEYRERAPDAGALPVIINSIDVGRMLALIGGGRLDELVRYLGGEVRRLAAAGADLALLAANTAHIVYDDVRRECAIPMVSIVEAARDAAASLGLNRVGIFGIRPTVQGNFYPAAFSRLHIEIVRPRPDEQSYIHDKYTGELLFGRIVPETRDRVLSIARRMRAEEAIDGLLLAGTELSPLLRGLGSADFPFLDTTQIHVKAAVDRLLT